jgi:ABC-2 type transport system ATP-binding protein
MIECRHVSKHYKNKKVLSNISLTINEGVIIGLVGPNGAGKSTFMQILSTIVKPSSGDILYNGNSIKKLAKDYKKIIGYVPQDLALYQTLTVQDNINFWTQLTNVHKDKEYVANIISVVGLEDKLNVKVQQLSGGMKRKLNIAIALFHDPKLIIMDEPTVGIDIQSKLEIIKFIQQLKDTGKTIIYSSHDAYEIEELCDEILILNQGEIKYEGSKAALATAAKEKGLINEDVSFTSILSKLGQW